MPRDLLSSQHKGIPVGGLAERGLMLDPWPAGLGPAGRLLGWLAFAAAQHSGGATAAAGPPQRPSPPQCCNTASLLSGLVCC